MKRLICIALVSACAGNGHTPGQTTDAAVGGGGDAPHADGPASGPQPTVFTIVLENHDYAEIIGHAPYVDGLIAQYGLATNYRDTNHPSLPNYLHMISGADQFGGGSDPGPLSSGFPVRADHLGTQLTAAHLPWRAYQESMGAPCRTADAYPYAPKHNPFIYFFDMLSDATLCATVDVDYSQFAADLASNAYRFMWITPNLLSDGHDPTADPPTGLAQTNSWLAANVPAILASDGFKAGGLLLITWDEAEGRNGDDPDQIPMIVISPKLKAAGMTSGTGFTHSSYAATVEDFLGLPRLPAVGTSPSLMEFLHP